MLDFGDEEVDYEMHEDLFENFPSHIYLLDAMHKIKFIHLRKPIVIAICYIVFVVIISIVVTKRRIEKPRQRRRIAVKIAKKKVSQQRYVVTPPPRRNRLQRRKEHLESR
uniref:Uncharacterized protein n=1 Tax=Aureoumbra lagunensis TaxID=44058 RepID=A0A7S3K6C9_9STRA|mmetsp:Transcript_20727/g.26827  ORF Transcript_20727/g.26827 Transcript_20727/m.26827 type:complete len:110 (+) Transcript_20727:55-384(+)